MDFTNKTIWITGASSGIGEALALEAAAQGANVVLSARNETKLIQVQSACKKLGSKAMVLPLDLAQADQFSTLAEQVIRQFKQIDILINNGGISQRSLATETPIEVDRKIMEINFFGNIALTKAVLPFMLAQKSGHIVTISSIVGKFGFPLRSTYSASKHALHGFYETLRAEIKDDNIQVSIVIPGRIKTQVSVNAISKDGKAHNQMDEGQADGLSAEACAKKILKGIARGKKEILVGRKELLLVHIRRFMPWLYYRIVNKIKPT